MELALDRPQLLLGLRIGPRGAGAEARGAVRRFMDSMSGTNDTAPESSSTKGPAPGSAESGASGGAKVRRGPLALPRARHAKAPNSGAPPRRIYGRKLSNAKQLERATASIFRRLERGELKSRDAKVMLSCLRQLARTRELALAERVVNQTDELKKGQR